MLRPSRVVGHEQHSGWTAALVWSRFHELASDALANVDGINSSANRHSDDAWWQGTFAPRISSIRGLPPLSAKQYQVFWHVGSSVSVLLAETRAALTRLLGYELAGAFQPKLRMCRIDINSMVRQVMRAPKGSWHLSSVHARTPGEGSALRVLSMYGSAVTESTLLRNVSDDLLFFACTLRQGNADFAALNGEGTIAVLREGARSLSALERVVMRLDAGGYLIRGSDGTPRYQK